MAGISFTNADCNDHWELRWFTIFCCLVICFGTARSLTDVCMFTKSWALFFSSNYKRHMNNELEKTALLVCIFGCAILTQQGGSHVLWQPLPSVCSGHAWEQGQASWLTWGVVGPFPSVEYFFFYFFLFFFAKHKWTTWAHTGLTEESFRLLCIKFITVIRCLFF